MVMLARKVLATDWHGMVVFRQLKRAANLLGIAFIRNPCTSKDSVRDFCRSMSMKAVVVEEFGDSSKLKYLEVTKPDPAEGEVEILIQKKNNLLHFPARSVARGRVGGGEKALVLTVGTYL